MTIQAKLAEAKLARSYARTMGDAKLARRMSLRINRLVSAIAFGE